MPGATPIFGIRFPYQGEIVSPADFQEFAEDVDAALDLLTVTGAAAVNRARVTLRRPTSGGSTASGATTDLPWSQVFGEDPASMWTIGTPENVVLPVKGLYHVSLHCDGTSPVTTVRAQRAQITVGGVQQLAERAYRDDRAISDAISVSGFAFASAASAVLVASYRWDGTGGPAAIPSATLTVALIAEVP